MKLPGRLCLLLLLLLSFPGLAWTAPPTQVLKADIRHRPPEMIVDGAYHGGPLKEILEEAAARIGYTVEWRSVPFQDSFIDLKSGKVDIVPRTIRTPEREPFVHFLGPIGSQRQDIRFLVRKGQEQSIRRYADLLPLAIGIKPKTAYFKPFDDDDRLNRQGLEGGDYALAKQFIQGDLDTVAVLDQPAIESAMAGLGFDDFTYADYRHAQTIENYFALSKQSPNAAVFDPLNAALADMTTSGRVAAIYGDHQTAVADRAADAIRLSVAEQKWLADHPGPFTVQNEMDYPPFNFNEGAGARGFSIDYMDLLAARLGLTIQYESGQSWDQFISRMRDGSLDIMVNIVQTSQRNGFLHFTEPYADNPPVFITRRDQPPAHSLTGLKDRVVAVPQGFFYQELLQRKYPDVPLKLTANLQEALMAVVGGDADVAIGGLAIENHLIQKFGLTNLRLDGVVDDPAFSNTLRIATRKDSPILRDILQKGMDNIPQERIADLQKKWFGTDLGAVSGRAVLTDAEKAWVAGLPHPVRVGAEMDWPPFDFVLDGRATGLSNDIIRLAAAKVGLPLEFVSGHSWAGLVERFEAGHIDVLPCIYRTPERAETMLFTSDYATNPSVLVVHADNRDIQRLDDLNGRTVAVVDGFATARVMAERFPGFRQKPMENVLAGLKSVSLGGSDAFIGSLGVITHLLKENIIPDIRLVSEVWLKKPEETRLHMAVPKNRTTLHGILQKGLDAMSDQEKRKLHDKWFPVATLATLDDDRVKLTVEEKYWLQEHPTLRLGDDFSSPPFTFLDADNRFSGIASGYAEAVSQRLGITFSPVTGLSREGLAAAVKTGEIDLLPAVSATEELNKHLLITKPYLSFPVVIATRTSGPFVDQLADLAGKRVGVVDGHVTHGLLARNHPDLRLIPIKGIPEGLAELEAGRIDALVDNLGVLTYEMDRLGLGGIKIAAPTPYTFDLSFGVRRDWPQLAAILDKALDSLDDRERAAIKNAWMAVNVQFGTDFSTILKWAVPTAAGALLVIGVILFSNRRLGREVAERKRAEQSVREGQERLNLALSSMTDGLFMLDKNLDFVFYNQHCRDLLQVPDELIRVGAPILGVIRHLARRGDYGEVDEASHIRERVAQLDKRESLRFELCIAGETFLELRQSPTTTGGVVVILTDISARKKSERAIQEREERINLALKGGNLGYWDVELNSGEMVVDDRWAEMLEYDLDELKAGGFNRETWIRTLHPEDRRRVLEAGEAFRRGGERTYQLEYRALTKTGAVRWLYSCGGIMSRDRRGTPLRMVGTVQDVTYRKEAELKIRGLFDIIRSSITYASRIQRSILPREDVIGRLLPDHFVLWEPRDVVGGDLYWCRPWGEGVLVMLGDCTGHGVPGAFMTLIANGALNESCQRTAAGDCATLLARMHSGMQAITGQDREDGESDDGIELGACFLTPGRERLIFSGARFSLFIVGPGSEPRELKGDRKGIGYRGIPADVRFTNHELDLLPDRTYYMTSDGIIDQVGGTNNRGFGKRRLKALMAEAADTPLQQQAGLFKRAIAEHQGTQERRDDLSMIGFRIQPPANNP